METTDVKKLQEIAAVTKDPKLKKEIEAKIKHLTKDIKK